jgi:hypothetical protein
MVIDVHTCPWLFEVLGDVFDREVLEYELAVAIEPGW